MCLFLLANKVHEDYKLIIAANRDEFYNRPAEPAKFWNENPGILAGKDLKAGGTWLGITCTGRIAALTNYRDLKNIKDEAPSRGNLTTDFLNSNISPEKYYEIIQPDAKDYNGFNLVFGELNSLYFFSNYSDEFIKLNSGIYGLSNCLLDTPWPKVEKVKNIFKEISSRNNFAENIFKMLYDKETAPDELLPDTGVGLELERLLSSVFIKSQDYGTRNSTIILIDKENSVTFIERTYPPVDTPPFDSKYNFKLDLNNVT